MADEKLKALMDKVRDDAKIITAWPEDWIVKLLVTGGKDVRAIRDGLDRAMRGREDFDAADEIAAVLKGKHEADLLNALYRSGMDLSEVCWNLGVHKFDLANDFMVTAKEDA